MKKLILMLIIIAIIIVIYKPTVDRIKSNDLIELTLKDMKPSIQVEVVPDPILISIKKEHPYIKRWKEVALKEQELFDIPASITLVQGIHESGWGKSLNAIQNNNYFGIKCPSNYKCKKGHCTNLSDDSHKDFFIKYRTAWLSHRAHSLFLRYHVILRSEKEIKEFTKTHCIHGKWSPPTGLYAGLWSLPAKKWPEGLKKYGYATDKEYAIKLTRISKKHKLYQYDKS